MKHTRYVLLATLLLLALTPMSILNTAAQQRYGGTFVIAWDNDPKHFNPVIGGITRQIITITANIYGALIYSDPVTSELKGYLAESWQYSNEGKRLTFRLVKNATWSDGTPFTSADVEFSYWEIARKYNPIYKAIFEGLEKVTATDPYTVVFDFKESSAVALTQGFSQGIGSILPKHIFQNLDFMKNDYNTKPLVSIGPYKFQEYVSGSHVTLVRNEKFFLKNKPYLDKVIFRFIIEPEARSVALESGEADYAIQLTEVAYKRFQTDKRFVPFVPNLESTTPIQRLEFNLRNDYLKNMQVRKAIAHAVDRAKLVNLAYGGLKEFRVSTSHIHYAFAWAHANNLPPYDYNVAKANQLLDDAGFKRGPDGTRFSIEVMHRPYDDERNMAAVIKENLKDVGIDVKIIQLERASFEQRMVDWKYDAVLLRYGTGPEPNDALYRMYHTNQILHVGWMNTMGYSNPEVDNLLDQQVREVDRAKRVKLLYRIQEILWDELPGLPLSDRAFLDAYNAKFAGQMDFEQTMLPISDVYWKEGSLVSKDAATEAILKAENMINDLKSKGYDIVAAEAKLKAAKDALAKQDYANAAKLAGEAPAVAVAPPPYPLYAAVVAVVVIVVGFVLYRKQKKKV